MKRYFGPLFAAMTIVLAASCSEQIGNELISESANLVKMTFSASMGEEVDSKTTYSGRKVYWEESDAITVFSVAENGVAKNVFSEPELLENRAVARFSGLADASADAYYAVYPHAESNNFSEDGISVKFPTTHTAFINGFPSGSNIAVAVSVKDSEQNLQFKNVGALLSFSFKDLETALNTQSVTFKAKKNDTEYWGLSGATTFTLDENGLPIAAEGDSQEVVVNAPEGGFNTGVAYFIPVIPVGECTGMEVVYTDLNGDTYTKRNDTDFELLRSYMFNIGQLRNPYPEVELPDNFEIELDFTKGWPFHTPFVSNQVNAGETYYLVYPVETKKKCLPIKIDGPGGENKYLLTEDGLKFTTVNNTMVYFPALKGMYTTRLFVKKTSTGRVNLNSKTSPAYGLTSVDFRIYEDMTIATYNTGGTLIYDGGSATGHGDLIKAAQNTSYHIRARDAAVVIKKITVTYSATAPGNAPVAE